MNRRTERLLVDGLACYRLTRLVTADTITRPIREQVYRFAYAGELDYIVGDLDAAVDDDMAEHKAPHLAELVRCRWCCSVWVAAGIVVARRLIPHWWAPVAELLAGSAVAVLISGLEE